MHWNYRIVNTKSENGGEDWYCLQEVYYNGKGEPYAYCNACTRHINVFSFIGEALPCC